jgi:hypothetical protein
MVKFGLELHQIGVKMLTEKERLNQRRLEARLTAQKNAEKSRHCVKAGANLPSQWGKVVTNEQRLIDNGHYMKSSEGARLDYLRERYRKAKKAAKSTSADIVLIKRV